MPTASASNSFFKNKPLPKESYKQHKCVKHSTKHRQKLTHEEICKYSKQGCITAKNIKPQNMYCTENLLSECYVNKSWVTANELVGLPKDIKIGLLTQGLSFKKGAKTGKSCGYYDPK